MRWQRVEEVFALAIEAAPTARGALLDAACAADAALRAEVESLLAHADGDERLRGPVAAAADALASTAAPAPEVGGRVGAYRLIERLGEGGMGTVFLAERDDAEYRRRVAIKVLRGGLASAEAIARFRDERQILARLDHPSIVRLLDGGTTAAGVPYLVMEHVDGEPLTAYARALPVRRKVELVRAICGALQHAHQKLIVHRDIKPGNLLVDASGAPKLLDFGIAKLLDDGAGREAQTRTGAALLTFEYASPEQARGEPVSVATDVYALGAVLYELLTGRPPQRAHDSMLETLRAICEVEPPRPSAVAPLDVRRALVGDLDNIVGKALQKAPAARYPSAAALADDLDRYLTGLPVTARATTFTYRARKFARRHRGKLALSALIVAALAASTVVSIVQARRARAQARVAELQTGVAEQQTRSLLVEQALQELAAGQASRALPYLSEVLRREDTAALRLLVAEALRPLEQQLGDTVEVDAGLLGFDLSSDGQTLVVTSYDGVRALDAALRVRTFLSTSPGWVRFDRHDRMVRWGADGVRAFELADPEGSPAWPVAAPGDPAAFAAAGDHVLVATRAGIVRVWDRSTGAVVFDRAVPGTYDAALAADGRALFLGRSDGVVERHDLVHGGAPRTVVTGDPDVLDLEATASGRLVTLCANGTARVWDAERLRLQHALIGHSTQITAWAIDREGQRLATADGHGVTLVWDLASGRPLVTLVAQGHAVRAVTFSPDGARVATAGADNTFRVWDARTGAQERVIESFAAAGDAPGSVGGALNVMFVAGGAELVTMSGTELKRWRLGREPVLADLAQPFPMWGARWSPDESRLAVVGVGAAIFDARSGQELVKLAFESSRLLDVTWSPDGRHLVLAGRDGFAAIYAADGTLAHRLTDHLGTVNGSTYSPDGRALLTCGDDGRAVIRDPVSGAPRSVLPHPARVLSATWSADGARVVTAGWDRTLRLWDVATGALVREIAGDTTQFLYATLSHDGALIASTGHDGEVTLWSTATGERVRSLEGHTGPATMAEWSPDGALLATSADDTTSRIWDPATGRQLAVLHQLGAHMQIWWSRDGERVMTVDHSVGIRTWSVRRDHRSVDEIAAATERLSPWRLVGTRLVRTR